jgi:hypothetical protein
MAPDPGHTHDHYGETHECSAILLTDYENASPATREVYDDFMRTTGATAPPVWIKSLGHSAALARAYWERAKGTLFSGNLPLPLKEMIVFVVSAKTRRATTAPPVTRRTC